MQLILYLANFTLRPYLQLIFHTSDLIFYSTYTYTTKSYSTLNSINNTSSAMYSRYQNTAPPITTTYTIPTITSNLAWINYAKACTQEKTSCKYSRSKCKPCKNEALFKISNANQKEKIIDTSLDPHTEISPVQCHSLEFLLTISNFTLQWSRNLPKLA
jgi:hypothetical protein